VFGFAFSTVKTFKEFHDRVFRPFVFDLYDLYRTSYRRGVIKRIRFYSRFASIINKIPIRRARTRHSGPKYDHVSTATLGHGIGENVRTRRPRYLFALKSSCCQPYTRFEHRRHRDNDPETFSTKSNYISDRIRTDTCRNIFCANNDHATRFFTRVIVTN